MRGPSAVHLLLLASSRMHGGSKSGRLGLWVSCSLDPATFSNEVSALCLRKNHRILPLCKLVNLADRTTRMQVKHTLTKCVACWYLCSHCAYNHCWCKVSEAHLESQDSRAGVAFQLLPAPEVNKDQQGFRVRWDLKVSDVAQDFFPLPCFTAINCSVVTTSLDGEEGRREKVCLHSFFTRDN